MNAQECIENLRVLGLSVDRARDTPAILAYLADHTLEAQLAGGRYLCLVSDFTEWLRELAEASRFGLLPEHAGMHEQDQSYAVRHAGAERALREAADAVKAKVPHGFGFGLFIFEFGEYGSMFWISNAQRPTIIKALREWIAKQQ
jgi:hypothetical protein